MIEYDLLIDDDLPCYVPLLGNRPFFLVIGASPQRYLTALSTIRSYSSVCDNNRDQRRHVLYKARWRDPQGRGRIKYIINLFIN